MDMKAGYRGTFVISWAQTELDGIRAAPISTLLVGAQWRWWGEVARVDGPGDLLMLGTAEGADELHRRAARSATRLLRIAGVSPEAAPLRHMIGSTEAMAGIGAPDQGFTVTDGTGSYPISMVTGAGGAVLLIFSGPIPPAGVDLFIVDHMVEQPACAGPDHREPGIICFVPGTRIATPDGPRLIEDIRAGDRVSTKDDGAQEVLWTGFRRMTGARLHAMPHLRPIRIKAGAMGEDRPDLDLIVSPQHRMLIKGSTLQSLFNQPEVLIAAADLVDGKNVLPDMSLREVTYFHLMTERHQIVWANGLETESFHPANASFDLIAADQRAALLGLVPDAEADPFRYGDFARRNLSPSEAAIMRYQAA